MVFVYVGTPTINTVCKVGNIISIATVNTNGLIIHNAVQDQEVMHFGITTNGDSKITLLSKLGANGVILNSNYNNYFLHGVLAGATSSPDASAILEARSTSKGFFPPAMTTAQKNAISSPATGLVVYDTTLNKLCVYTGSGWETVTSA